MKVNIKRVIAIVAIILLITLITVLLTLFQNKKQETKAEKWPEKISSKEQAETYVDNLSDLIINGGNKKEYEEAFGNSNIPQIYIMTGENSPFREKPSDKLINKYNLEKYVKKQEELAKNLEQHIKENFSYKIEGTVEEETYLSVLVTYKSYYYLNYSKDLGQIQMQLLAKAGYNLEENIVENNKFIVDSFKAKIKAAELLNDYLDKYNNNSETNTIYIKFINKEKKSSFDNLQSYLINLNGYAYHNNSNLSMVANITPVIDKLNADNALEL